LNSGPTPLQVPEFEGVTYEDDPDISEYEEV
jgi:hypothetical protein